MHLLNSLIKFDIFNVMPLEVQVCIYRFLLNYIIIQLLNNVSDNHLSVQYFHSFHGWVTTKTLPKGWMWVAADQHLPFGWIV